MPELVIAQEDGISVGVNKNDKELLDKINETLQQLIDSGEIDTLIQEAITKANEN